jgi:hypothetical protein
MAAETRLGQVLAAQDLALRLPVHVCIDDGGDENRDAR